MKTIDIEDVGPITRISLPVPEGGGLVVLEGSNGSGKTHALASVSRLAGDDIDLTIRDGQDRGHVSGLGADVILTLKQTRDKGELEACSIGGRLSLAELIDPQIADPERADAKRIKALLSIAGVKADATLFADLVPGVPLESFVSPGVLKADDIVSVAAGIKKAVEQVARDAEAAQGLALDKAKRESPPADAKLDGVRPVEEVAAALEAAVRRESEVSTLIKAATEAHERHRQARERLASVGLPDLEKKAADTLYDQQRSMQVAKERTIYAADLREKLAAAEADLAKATSEAATCVREAKAAQIAVDNAKALEATLQEALPAIPDPTDLTFAQAAVDRARKDSDEQAVLRKNVEQAAKAAEHFEAADRAGQRAQTYRKAADKIEAILSDAVGKIPNCPFAVRKNRLCLPTDRAPDEHFGDLSDGERTLTAVDIGIGIVHRDEGLGILVLPQPQFEGISPAKRLEIRDKLRAAKVVLYGAAVTDGEKLTAREVTE